MCNSSVHSLHFSDYELPDSTLILMFNYSLLKLKESPNSIVNAHSFAKPEKVSITKSKRLNGADEYSLISFRIDLR